MAVLVTGGAGYIGSHCVRQLLEKGADVVVLDNLSTGNASALSGGRFYKGDLLDRDFVRGVFEKEPVRSVIHFAAFSQVGESYQDPGKYFRNNVGGSLSLLDAMADQGVKNIVFSSTAAIYGEPEKTPIEETDPYAPTNPYGESKLIVERMLAWYERIHGIKYCPLRYFNVAGAWPDGSIGEDHQPETHLIPLVLQTALGQRDFITIFGRDYPTPDGSCIRDYIHVCDLIDCHLRALDYLERGGESTPFNLGIGEGFSVLEIIRAARKVTGTDIPVRDGDRRQGDPSVLIASGQKAMEVLGWRPLYTQPEAIIEDAWRWHRKKAGRS